MYEGILEENEDIMDEPVPNFDVEGAVTTGFHICVVSAYIVLLFIDQSGFQCASGLTRHNVRSMRNWVSSS